MTLDSKSDIIVGIRAYDDENGKNFNIHLIGHCGDQTKNFYQRKLILSLDSEPEFSKLRLDRVKFDRFLDTKIALYKDKSFLLD